MNFFATLIATDAFEATPAPSPPPSLWQRWRARLQRRRCADSLRELDDAELRDMGIYRCEIDSIVSEAYAPQTPTRIRVVQTSNDWQ